MKTEPKYPIKRKIIFSKFNLIKISKKITMQIHSKKIEIDLIKEKIWLYIETRKDVLGSVCIKELEIYNQGKWCLDWLTLHGYLTRVKKTIGGKRQYQYNASIPYKKPTYEVTEDQSKKNQNLKVGAIRTIKLLDRSKSDCAD